MKYLFLSIFLGFRVFMNTSIGQLIYPTQFFDHREYGAGRDVWCIGQASDGKFYFGTSSALVRYDGERWVSATIPGENTIYSLLADDTSGRVYVGAGGRFGYFSYDLQYHPLSERLDSVHADFGTVWGIENTSHGLYFRSTKYLFRYFEDKLYVIHAMGPSERPFDVAYKVRDTLYTHIREVGLARVFDGKLELLSGEKFDKKCNSFLEHPKGLLIGTRYDGLFIYDGNEVRPFSSEADFLFKKHHIYSGSRLQDGKYAFATLSGGLVIMEQDGAISHQVNKENYGLNNEGINHVYEDFGGDLWLGTPSGILYADRTSPLRTYQFPELEGYIDFAWFQDHLYFGTDKGIYRCKTDGTDLQWIEGTSGRCAQIIVSNNQLFASNYDLGITYEIKEKTATKILQGTGWVIAKKDTSESHFIAKLHEYIYLVENEGNKWSKIKRLDGLPYNVVAMNSYKDDILGISISAGLFRYSEKSGLHLYNRKDITAITTYQDDLIVTGQDKFYQIDLENNDLVPFEQLNSYLPKHFSRLHGFEAKGDTICVFYYQHRNLTGDVYVKDRLLHKLPLFDVTQGDQVILSLVDHRLFVGSNERISFYDFTEYREPSQPIEANITSDQVLKDSQRPYSLAQLSFDFAIDRTSAFGDNLYRYQLKGLSDTWTDWSNQNRLQVVNLREGNYELNLEVLTPDRYISNSSFRFTILPPWYRTIWAYLIYVAIILGLIWLYIRYTVRRAHLQSVIELKNQEAELHKATDQLKSEFFANISHELRTPLTLIQGNLESVEKNINGDVLQKQKIIKARRNTRQLAVMIDDLLDLSRLELGHYKLKQESVPVNIFIRRIVSSFQALSDERGIKTVVESDLPDSLTAYLDQKQFEKVINNLLYNAFKFSSSNTTLTINLSSEGDSIVLKVMDQGSGIAEADLLHVFDRFYRSKNQADKEGTGLGLAITKEIVEHHGGTISVESTKGLGSVFTIEFPKGSISETEDYASSVDLPTAGQLVREKLLKWEVDRPSVLIVEDNVEMQEYLLEILSENFVTHISNNGKEALKWLKEKRPHLIISDAMMPEMDGFQLLEHLKKDPELRQLPFIMLTAKSGKDDRFKALRLAVDDYMTKPFDQDELMIRACNLIDNLQNRIHWNTSQSEENHAKLLAPEEEELVRKLQDYVLEHIKDSQLHIEDLADHVAMSERQLRRRLSASTGLSPNEFVMEVRLQRAYQLLAAGEVTKLAPLATEVGIGTPAYLTTQFFKRFGKKPSEFY